LSIALPIGLPARSTLAAEGVEVLTPDELHRRGGRPLRICLVNLMPNKIVTETQICRLLGATSIPVALTLCLPDSYRSKTTPASHIASFYRPWSQLRDERFDGLVVTGAPIETLPFEDVTYWSDLLGILDWAQSRIASSLYICWAAQAALYHFHAVSAAPGQASGVFRQRVAGAVAPARRLRREFGAGVALHGVRAADLPTRAGLSVLAPCRIRASLIEDRDNRALHSTTWVRRRYLAAGIPARPAGRQARRRPLATFRATIRARR
jgi:homoserine O-succinyltransferase